MGNEVAVICWTKLGVYIDFPVCAFQISLVLIVQSGRRRRITLVWKRTVGSTLKTALISDDFPDWRCMGNPNQF